MAVSITLDFDDTWAARLAPMINSKIDDMKRSPLIIALIEPLPGIDTVDDLTTKQKAKLLILVGLLRDLQRFEGDVDAAAARQTVINDIATNFPLEVGDA